MSSAAPAASYRAVLRTPYAARTFAPALLGRLSYGMAPLALLLAVQRATGSYATAGLVMALFGAASVFLSPARAALIDRFGVPRALPPMAALYALLLTALALLTWHAGGDGGVAGGRAPLVALATAAGACTPPLGPVMRTLWSRLVPGKDLLRRAYSLDAVGEELLFLSGPLLVGALMTFTGPAAGVLAGAVLVALGAAGVALSPVAASRPVAATAAEDGAPGTNPAPLTGRRTRTLTPALLRVVLVLGAVGLCLGALDLLVVAYAEAHHAPGAVTWTLAALSAGSAVGGLVYGAVHWRSTGRTQLLVCAGALGTLLALGGLAPTPLVLALVVAASGLFFAPAMTTAYLAADENSAPERRTQAGAWVNTAFNAGSSAGSALVGLALGHVPLALCFPLAAVPLLAAAALGALPALRAAVPGRVQAAR